MNQDLENSKDKELTEIEKITGEAENPFDNSNTPPPKDDSPFVDNSN